MAFVRVVGKDITLKRDLRVEQIRVMPQDSERPLPAARGFFVAAAIGAALALLALPFDTSLALALNSLLPTSEAFWLHVEAWAPTVLFLAVLIPGAWLWFCARSATRRVNGVLLLAVPLLGICVADALKVWVARARPMSAIHGLVERGLNAPFPAIDTKSFPSGHVVTAASAACVLWLLFHRHKVARALFLLMPLLVLDRTVLARHFLSDAVASVALSLLVCAVLLSLLRGREVRPSGAWRGLALLATILALGFAFARPAHVVDAATLMPSGMLRVVPTLERVLLEPVAGPALALARWSSPREFAMASAPLIALGLLVLLVLPWSTPWRVRLVRVSCAALWLAGVAAFAWWGWAAADRFVSQTPGLVFDGHVHAGDKVDGAASIDTMLQRARDHGVDVVVITNHDAHPAEFLAPEGLTVLRGMEWSGGAHERGAVSAHLLCYGPEAALQTALLQRLTPEDFAEGNVARKTLEAVRAVRASGGLISVAHDARTRAALTVEQCRQRIPSRAEYVAAGVDGFEVAHRALCSSATEQASCQELAGLCKSNNIVGFGNSDAHGRFSGSPCITFLPGEFPAEPTARREAVLQHFLERREVRALVVAAPQARVAATQASALRALLAPVQMLWDYLRTMPGWGRVSWLAWGTLLAAWCSRRRCCTKV